MNKMEQDRGDFDHSQRVLLYFVKRFGDYVHISIALAICILGSMTNITNIIVFTRKNMISPTNVLLTGLAIADLAQLLNYFPYTCYLLAWRLTDHNSYENLSVYYDPRWHLFKFWNAIFSLMLSSISVWQTTLLAVWRYIGVTYPFQSRYWCSMEATCIAVVTCYILCLLLCIALFFMVSVSFEDIEWNQDRGVTTNKPMTITNTTITVITLRYSSILNLDLNFPLNFCFWRIQIYSVLLRLIPSTICAILSVRSVCTVLKKKRHRQDLIRGSNQNLDTETEMDRATRMPLTVLFILLLTEVPQGILAMLILIFNLPCSGERLVRLYKLDAVFDIMTLINAAVNFVLYYSMCRQFRTTCNALLFCNERLQLETEMELVNNCNLP